MVKVKKEKKIRCKAKSKRTGEQCGQYCAPGKTVCKWHGGNCKGAPKGNKNSVSHGAYETICLDTMTQEEIEFAQRVTLDPLKTIEQEIRILSVREKRILVRIKRAMQAEFDAGQKNSEGKTKASLVIVGGSQTLTEYADGSQTKSATTDSESHSAHILKLENALTGVQVQISRLVEQKGRILAERREEINSVVDAYGGVRLEGIAPSFLGFVRDVRLHQHTHYFVKGGRGSTKSSTVAKCVVDLVISNPDAHAVVNREVKDTLKDSVYAQLEWAIEELGQTHNFIFRKSPMEIIYRPTGQKVLFRGLDDPQKLKSIKIPFGYIAVVWYEEASEIRGGMETVRNVNQSLMRGGDKFWCFYSYNPPKSKNNWINVAADQWALRMDTLVHSSNYLDVPPEWLGEQFILEASHLKEMHPALYEHEYMGVATGSGGDVFDNVVDEILPDDLTTEMTRYGIDFGFAVDPFAWGKCGYNQLYDTLYILGEFAQTKMHDDAVAKKLKEFGVIGEVHTCDSAEPKSIASLQREGVNHAIGCKKFPGSREFGYKQLQRWRRIVIDRRRTPKAWEEFNGCEYERDKDGNFLSVIPKRNDHVIDAVRYSLDREINAARSATVQYAY